jgi:pyridoxamine 5'-phosphate oxidase
MVTETRFLGIDFGWQNKPSGLAALTWNGHSLHLLALDRLSEIQDILRWVDHNATPDTVIGVDAPLVIPNLTGMRQADRLAHSRFGRYHAGGYPASRQRSFWQRTTGLASALMKRGFVHGDRMAARSPGRYQIEVHPHAASVQLFTLDQIVKYKKGTLAVRRAGLERLRALLLEHLPRLTPRLALATLPEVPENGPALKDLEDRLDALTAAYIAAYWWFWGIGRNDVLGDAKAGYIVVPQRARLDYSLGGLLEADAADDPLAQFERWFADARLSGMKEPNAMTLATVDGQGQPSARIVLLKGADKRGFVFYTNYESRKGRELANNPQAALVFFWPELERQVRITGAVAKVSRAESRAYFQSRPRGSQLGAWASAQSTILESRRQVEERVRELEQRYSRGKPIPLPPFWGGYRLAPASIEFWQGRPSRLHDRLRYTVDRKGIWQRERLSP